MIRLNPGGAFPAFAFICDALAPIASDQKAERK